MFWIVESFDQLKSFYNIGYKEAYIEVIPYSYKIHPTETSVSLVYIRPLDSPKGYMLAIDHSEAMRLNSEYIAELISTYDTLWVWGKKEFLHLYARKNINDLSLSSPNYEMETTRAHKFFQQKYPNKEDINRIIPIVKHYEACEKNYNNLKQYINEPINKFYNDTVPLVFNAIERNGIQVDSQLFEDYFDKPGKNRIYTQYNYRTTTTRPSNRFGGINYAALNKENGCRKAFIPGNDKFIEIDISAYHPTLAASLIDYNFNTEDIHGEFAKMYKVDYKKSKELTFKQLYGGVFKQYRHLEFFQKIEKYVSELWDKFETDGYIECPISNHRFKKDKLDNMNPQKLFNYLLQNLETANNVRILWRIIKLLRKKNTKLVLYTYDSFLFDLDKTEEDIINNGILKIFKEYNLQVKINYGTNYDFE
tara:strand:- start:10420 stop:11682 length:1263 start_codon:yes stop_codon:yes gene_type:complete